MSVFGLRWCGMGRGLDQGLEGWGVLCVSCETGFFVHIAGPGIYI